MKKGSFEIKVSLAEMLKGGVIMDVTNVEQACIAEKAGAVAVMALEKIPADIRRDGGVCRMSNPKMITDIKENVSIPVMAKCRIGHFAEAQILESLEIDFIDESEVLTPADNSFHVDKNPFKVPFVCGARNLSEASRRINEGAAMIRTKGEAGSGNIVEAVTHMRTIMDEIKLVTKMNNKELEEFSIKNNAPLNILTKVKELGKLPVPNFSAGGIATPADASLMMQLGAESVFVGSGIFKSEDPKSRAEAIVEATTYYDNPKRLAEISSGLKEAMEGIDIADIPENEMLQNRGW
ncbi:MAG: pyridoxal 5'-phosphate synthase lyase subunit PdxS [Candidatus Marinimicrobia bacterium]|nr:pyridoxal 5'-phosphate synthase lyase subunit PdxS [Candidatus Neomarinimicrobiota bacterium]